MTVVQADAVLKRMSGGEYGSWRKANASLNCKSVKFHRIYGFRELEPDEVPSPRICRSCSLRQPSPDRSLHFAKLRAQSPAHLPQVPIETSVLKVIGNACLCRDAGRQRRHQFQPLHSVREATGRGPPNSVAGCERLGERPAVHDKSLPVERPCWQRVIRLKMQFPVDVIFNQRNFVFREEFYKS